ncbi:putative haloacid type ii [Mycena sanguinolenta]|uniref:Putative haloacid type ii n=1 Tax=Mycena sanguinolenta TaxID=230812 RepID=A0A8H6YG30_9AGAR|nr:putative haloacid type ii [Mycena sanguinolenta]
MQDHLHKRQSNSDSNSGRSSKKQRQESDQESDSDADMPALQIRLSKEMISTFLKALETQHGAHLHNAIRAFQQMRVPFSKAEPATVMAHFGLADSKFEDWPEINLPDILLPDHLYTEYCESTCKAFANPGFLSALERESATGLLLSSNFQHLVAQFGGILNNKPERPILGIDVNTGGKIEGQIFCRTDHLVHFRELKPSEKMNTSQTFRPGLAQTMLDLHVGWHMNRYTHTDIPPDRLTPVYTCVYDLSYCYFIKFDGKMFSKRTFPLVQLPSVPTEDSIKNYIRETFPMHVFNFAVLLEGYICSTELYYHRSAQRPPMEKSHITDGWFSALEKAVAARDHFRRAASHGDHKHAERGLSLLCSSLEAWPPVISGDINLLLPNRIASIVKDLSHTYKGETKPDPDQDWQPPTTVLRREDREEAALRRFWESVPGGSREKFEHILTPVVPNPGTTIRTLEAIAAEPAEWKQVLLDLSKATPLRVEQFLDVIQHRYRKPTCLGLKLSSSISWAPASTGTAASSSRSPDALSADQRSKFALEWRQTYFDYNAARLAAGQPPEDIDLSHRLTLTTLLNDSTWSAFQPAFTDSAPPALAALRAQGYELFVHANGTTRLQLDLVRSSGLAGLFDCLFSSELLGVIKPAPESYRRGLELLRYGAEECVMVAAHAYDTRGAKAVGMRTVYVYRWTDDIREDQAIVKGEHDVYLDGMEGLVEAVVGLE